MLYITDCSEHAANLTGSRDAPHVSTLPPDAALFAVEKAIPLLQELGEKKKEKKKRKTSSLIQALLRKVTGFFFTFCPLMKMFIVQESYKNNAKVLKTTV